MKSSTFSPSSSFPTLRQQWKNNTGGECYFPTGKKEGDSVQAGQSQEAAPPLKIQVRRREENPMQMRPHFPSSSLLQACFLSSRPLFLPPPISLILRFFMHSVP